MFLVGFGLFGSFVMLPLFVQNMLGYTATWAGLVLSPGGIASLFAMAFVGNLIGKVDTRLLVFIGAIMNIFALWLLWSISLGVDFQYVMWSRIFQGFGLGFLFVPITTAAYTRIQATQMGDATGLFNLLRNEGGSVGIALSATLLSQRAQFHQSRLVENLTPLNPAYQERLNAVAQGLFLRSGHSAYSSGQLALGIVQGELERQAVLMAFVDVFFVLTCVFVLLLPFIFLLKGKTPAGELPAGH